MVRNLSLAFCRTALLLPPHPDEFTREDIKGVDLNAPPAKSFEFGRVGGEGADRVSQGALLPPSYWSQAIFDSNGCYDMMR